MKNIITLTTIPTRTEYLVFFLKNFENQSIQPDKIELYIPYEYARRNLGKIDLKKIPSDFNVIRCEDFGPATKIIPALKNHKNDNVRLIFCDDDRYYSNEWLSRLIKQSENNPTKCIADEVTSVDALLHLYKEGFIKKDINYRLKRLFSLGLWKPKNFNNVKPNIIHGFGGVVVKPKFFCDLIFNIPDVAWPNDDIWISANLEKNDVEIMYTKRKKKDKSQPIFLPGEKYYQDDELVNAIIHGKNKLNVNYSIIKYCIENLEIWKNYKPLIKE